MHVISRGADPPPFELIKALICREFHMSPEQVENHPADTLFQAYSVLNLYDTQVSKLSKK
jgi:hypothetical protein